MKLLPQSRQQKKGCIIGASIAFILYALAYFISFATGQTWLTHENVEYIHWLVCLLGSLVGILFAIYPRFKGSLVIYIISMVSVIALNLIYFFTIIDQYVSYLGQLLAESALQVTICLSRVCALVCGIQSVSAGGKRGRRRDSAATQSEI